MNELTLVGSYLLGLLPIYLMLARMNSTLGTLKSDHRTVEKRLDRLEQSDPDIHPFGD